MPRLWLNPVVVGEGKLRVATEKKVNPEFLRRVKSPTLVNPRVYAKGCEDYYKSETYNWGCSGRRVLLRYQAERGFLDSPGPSQQDPPQCSRSGLRREIPERGLQQPPRVQWLHLLVLLDAADRRSSPADGKRPRLHVVESVDFSRRTLPPNRTEVWLGSRALRIIAPREPFITTRILSARRRSSDLRVSRARGAGAVPQG